MDARLSHALDLFNRREFFECHEALEALWMPETGPRRLFLQALIHFAVAFYHDGRGNSVGASRQLRKALRKLAPHLPSCDGIDTARLYRDGVAALEGAEAGAALAGYPRVHLVRALPART